MGIADDIVVCGNTEQEHDRAFIEMLEATRAHNVSLNSEKLQFKQSKVDFFDHTLTDQWIQQAKDKLEAIRNMKTPSNVKELQTILWMVTYLNRYSSKLACLTAPLSWRSNMSVSNGNPTISKHWTKSKKNFVLWRFFLSTTLVQPHQRFYNVTQAKKELGPG